MPEKQKKTIRELTLMLMYLTSWEAVSYTHLDVYKRQAKYP